MTDQAPPRVENAPGIVWKKRKTGWQAIWQARTDLVQRGFLPKVVRLWVGVLPTDLDAAYIADMCRRLQDDMLVWGRGGIPTVGEYDGTLQSLIICYQTDRDSGYQKLRYHSRETYNCMCRRIDDDHGDVRVADIKARNLKRWHEDWLEDGKVAMAHGLIGMVRTLATFGSTILDDMDCRNLKGLLHDMRFKTPQSRMNILTAQQVELVRAKAHEMGYHSMALAQAIQFECMLRQKDVIGEWVPMNEPGTSDVISGNDKWLRGIRWSEIDDDLILRHVTSKRGKLVEPDLKIAAMVLEEFRRLPEIPETGPVIVNEDTGLPYLTHQFRRRWRLIANAAGIPKSVRNMDSRAGAISEATNAGASLEHIRHAATHGDIAMTQRYSRDSAEKTANVMRMRVAGRNKTGTSRT